jgi:hypothetical protein
MIHPSIQAILPQITQLLRFYKIESAALFGSVLSDSFNDGSDIDLIVNLQKGQDPLEAGENLWNLTFELEDLTNRKVDILTERSLRNPIFIAEIHKTKYPIYG